MNVVAQTLSFAPKLVDLADKVIAGMRAAGVHSYNGLHLRIERDAQDWAIIMGGDQVLPQHRDDCDLQFPKSDH